ncbi:cytochrome c3 family protein [bacterium AH-315-J04]|nr:cytochrome c3 family protein [bacterium AH-315-J04]
MPNGRVECTSCHDPHNQSGAPYMLVKSNARSALCLTCHKK